LLPERHNDFIFAMIAHQWGFLGSLALLACYGVMVVIGMDVATTTKDPFGRLVAVGFATLIAVQALTNLCMTVGLGPITGVTLPFVSAGGSSLIASFLCIGLLISVAQHRPLSMGRLPFEFDEEAERYNRLG
jgi:cell division protein FtsW (lipid II flippase)